MEQRFDAIVIGAGEAGTEVASRVVEAGQRVAMVYKRPYGSTCLNTGCVPSKFMIHRARVAQVVRGADHFHVRAGMPQVDLAAIVREKDEMVAAHRDQSFGGAQAAANLTLIEGEARFLSDRRIAVGDRTLRADTIFVATGMRPLIPGIDGLDRVPFLTNESVMDLTELPEHLIVVGGGYIACELGQTFRRYGSRVTIVQSRDHLVPHEEPDVSTLLERALTAEGIELVLGHRVTRVEPAGSGVRVTAHAEGGRERIVEGTYLLIAAGRRPNTDTLALETAGVEVDEKGFVTVDEYLQTTAPGIWAIGDVNGEQPFTRVCQEEGKVAYANSYTGARIKMERHYLGRAIFTDPEIGSVGLTEREARAQGHDVAAGLVTFDRVEKAELIGETTGLIKYVVERDTRRLLGCHVIGPQAADL
ncbi:MAG: NAD(P)/FAD-dependent oxidoreductase, partial [Dehalococcoidia bacterium]